MRFTIKSLVGWGNGESAARSTAGWAHSVAQPLRWPKVQFHARRHPVPHAARPGVRNVVWRAALAGLPWLLVAGAAAPAEPAAAAPQRADLRTRHATFTPASFRELPGWDQDDVVAGWPAFLGSCTALEKRDAWRSICAEAAGVARTPVAIRAFFEARFAPLRILNRDASQDGEITGYFEPLLEGRRQRDSAFNLPVLGVPRDLFTLDWLTVPAAQRQGVIHVKMRGSNLIYVPGPETASAALDLRQFELDTKDRRLRVQVTPNTPEPRARPYPTRAEMAAMGLPQGVDAPVLAWVSDALALYAMQIQGAGRIRMADGSVLRVQYGEQNGRPFKPFRVVARTGDRVQKRAIGVGPEVDSFALEGADIAQPEVSRMDAQAPPDDAVLTRGLPRNRPPAGVAGQDAAAMALVVELLGNMNKRATPTPSPAARSGTAAMPATATATLPTRKPSTAAAALPPGPSSLASAVSSAVSSATVPAARAAVAADLLNADPSYVFFKLAPIQAPSEGPPGALGVPLTPGRSVAVDPRVTPLGYPIFLSAPPSTGSAIDLRRLMFAQDTGGAIRGAVRADFFWGHGPDAGRLARSTRRRGEMWLLMPQAEVARLSGERVVTRAIGDSAARGECLVADDEFCQEPE